MFTDLPAVLEGKIEQVVRLIRSKGVGVYFVTQNPADIPDVILGQLGNRVQHALRAFTPKDQKVVRSAAETLRPNPKLAVEDVITQLGVGEALVSLLDDKGTPRMVERAFICPPHGQIGPVTPQQRKQLIASSVVNGIYEQTVDRESAYERLKGRAEPPVTAKQEERDQQRQSQRWYEKLPSLSGLGGPSTAGRGHRGDTLVEAAMKSAVRSMGTQVGRQIIRGVLGSILGGSSRR